MRLGEDISCGDFQRIGVLNKPPEILLTVISDLQAENMMGLSRILEILIYFGSQIS
jgi:hypothetical protein